MRQALEDWDGGISIGGKRITNLRYADDTILIAETKKRYHRNYGKSKVG